VWAGWFFMENDDPLGHGNMFMGKSAQLEPSDPPCEFVCGERTRDGRTPPKLVVVLVMVLLLTGRWSSPHAVGSSLSQAAR
jgi:hypothetical protein